MVVYSGGFKVGGADPQKGGPRQVPRSPPLRSCGATTEFVQFLICFCVLGVSPAALPYTVRVVRRL